ncbi:hypothetical protein [Vibrio splendidus]|uniref:hypothetical protein n=1 Tax=Vibrio splendidus TaxID=29497 RepID=UPI003D0F62B4
MSILNQLQSQIEKQTTLATSLVTLQALTTSNETAIHNKNAILAFAKSSNTSAALLNWLESLEPNKFVVEGQNEPIDSNTNGHDIYQLTISFDEIELSQKVVDEVETIGSVFVGDYLYSRSVVLPSELSEVKKEAEEFITKLAEEVIDNFKSGRYLDQYIPQIKDLETIDLFLYQNQMTDLNAYVYADTVSAKGKEIAEDLFNDAKADIKIQFADIIKADENDETSYECKYLDNVLSRQSLTAQGCTKVAFVHALCIYSILNKLSFGQQIYLLRKHRLTTPHTVFEMWFEGVLAEYQALTDLQTKIPVLKMSNI